MAELLRYTDQWGRVIVLSEEQWFGHILIGHGELLGQVNAIHRVLTKPDRVNFDQRHTNGENFYAFGVLPSPLERVYPKVCVRFNLQVPDNLWVGVIVTAYAVSAIKRAEVQKWP